MRSTSATNRFGRARLAIDGDSLFDSLQMGRRVEAGSVAGGGRDRGGHGRRRALSLRARDMHDRQTNLRIAEALQQAVHPLELKVAMRKPRAGRSLVIDPAQEKIEGRRMPIWRDSGLMHTRSAEIGAGQATGAMEFAAKPLVPCQRSVSRDCVPLALPGSASALWNSCVARSATKNTGKATGTLNSSCGKALVYSPQR